MSAGEITPPVTSVEAHPSPYLGGFIRGLRRIITVRDKGFNRPALWAGRRRRGILGCTAGPDPAAALTATGFDPRRWTARRDGGQGSEDCPALTVFRSRTVKMGAGYHSKYGRKKRNKPPAAARVRRPQRSWGVLLGCHGVFVETVMLTAVLRRCCAPQRCS